LDVANSTVRTLGAVDGLQELQRQGFDRTREAIEKLVHDEKTTHEGIAKLQAEMSQLKDTVTTNIQQLMNRDLERLQQGQEGKRTYSWYKVLEADQIMLQKSQVRSSVHCLFFRY
jgi:hypothetical protein